MSVDGLCVCMDRLFTEMVSETKGDRVTMTRPEILQVAKPSLFNTEMVQAILDWRKTVTRRVIKFPQNKYTREIPKPDEITVYKGTLHKENVNFHIEPFYCMDIKKPYNHGDYLYVPEAWKCTAIYKTYGYNTYGYEVEFKDGTEYYFEFLNKERFKKFEKYLDKPEHQWNPSIHMPKEAARIFLLVTDVGVERLQEITAEGIRAEGLSSMAVHSGDMDIAQKEFALLWDSTIPPKDRDKYGWQANPWVWVIEFERVGVAK